MTTLTLEPVVYNTPTMISLGAGRRFTELVAPGALTPALRRSPRIAALRDHDPSRLLGRVSSGTVTLDDGPLSLRAAVKLPDTELGRETEALVRRRDLAGASFAFLVNRDSWHDGEGGVPVRVIEEVDELFDISCCTFPAYQATSVWVTPRSEAMTARQRRVKELEGTIRGRPELRVGPVIAPPKWVPKGGLHRRGCGHLEVAGWETTRRHGGDGFLDGCEPVLTTSP